MSDTNSSLGGIEPSHVGWHALKHRDGWWVGTEAGVTCYEQEMTARYALTVAWQRDGGRELKFTIETYTGEANVDAGDYTPKYDAQTALQRYESKEKRQQEREKRAAKRDRMKCDVCGRFLKYLDIESGNAIVRMDTPDSDVSSETWTILCPLHREL